MKIRADELSKGDVIHVDNTFYTIFDKRPKSRNKDTGDMEAIYQARTLVGTTIQLAIVEDVEYHYYMQKGKRIVNDPNTATYVSN